MDDRENEKSLKASSVLLDGDPESDPEDFNQHQYDDEESIPDGKSVKSEDKTQFRPAFSHNQIESVRDGQFLTSFYLIGLMI